MELNSGPKIANSTCGKTIDVETIDRDSTVYKMYCIYGVCTFLTFLYGILFMCLFLVQSISVGLC